MPDAQVSSAGIDPACMTGVPLGTHAASGASAMCFEPPSSPQPTKTTNNHTERTIVVPTMVVSYRSQGAELPRRSVAFSPSTTRYRMRAMPIELPQRQYVALQDVAARLFESRKTGGVLEQLARELLRGFFDVCTYAGLDNVLEELKVSERTAFEDDEIMFAALIAQLQAIDLDGGGPRNAKPRQLAECVVAALGDDVRVAVAAAIAGVVNTELAAPAIRDAIIAEARTRCEESFHGSFNKIVA